MAPHCTLHTAHCTLHTAHCSHCTVSHSTQQTIAQCTLQIVHCPLYTQCIQILCHIKVQIECSNSVVVELCHGEQEQPQGLNLDSTSPPPANARTTSLLIYYAVYIALGNTTLFPVLNCKQRYAEMCLKSLYKHCHVFLKHRVKQKFDNLVL